MRWIVQTSLRYRYLVIFIALVLMASGVIRLRNSSVDVFPEFAPPKVEVQTFSLGLSASAVEELVTVPLEQALNGTPGLDVMRSRSNMRTVSGSRVALVKTRPSCSADGRKA